MRKIGSGNIGATNVLRTGQQGAGRRRRCCSTLLKGTVAVLLVDEIASATAAFDAISSPTLSPASAPSSATSIPVWLGFQGGKGVATYIGVLLGIALAGCARLLPGLARRWRWLTRYSSLAALIAAVVAVVLLLPRRSARPALLFIDPHRRS